MKCSDVMLGDVSPVEIDPVETQLTLRSVMPQAQQLTVPPALIAVDKEGKVRLCCAVLS